MNIVMKMSALAGLAFVVVGGLPGEVAVSAAATTCGGREATITGTDGDDRLAGTDGRDVIAGLGGSDQIDGRGGRDIICGGGGTDFLLGGIADTQDVRVSARHSASACPS
jgi:Ca2+-binding RTX toxin-like protein